MAVLRCLWKSIFSSTKNYTQILIIGMFVQTSIFIPNQSSAPPASRKQWDEIATFQNLIFSRQSVSRQSEFNITCIQEKAIPSLLSSIDKGLYRRKLFSIFQTCSKQIQVLTNTKMVASRILRPLVILMMFSFTSKQVTIDSHKRT